MDLFESPQGDLYLRPDSGNFRAKEIVAAVYRKIRYLRCRSRKGCDPLFTNYDSCVAQ